MGLFQFAFREGHTVTPYPRKHTIIARIDARQHYAASRNYQNFSAPLCKPGHPSWDASSTTCEDEVQLVLTKSNGSTAEPRQARVSDHMQGQTSWNSTDSRTVMVIAVAWAVAGLLIGLHGEFPLNDDWSYSLAAQSLSEDHEIRFSEFTSMPLLAQLLWSWLFTEPFGFSFTALRVSTWVLGGIGGLALYVGARQVGARHAIAAVVTAVVMTNPLYVALSATFMTDVPFLAFFVLSVTCTLRGLVLRHAGWVIAGVVAALASTLIRQLGLAVLVGMAPGILLAWGVRPRHFVWACLPAMLGVVTLLGFQEIAEAMQLLPDGYRYRTDGMFALFRDLSQGHLGTLQTPLRNMAILALYAGLFLLGPALAALPLKSRIALRLFFGTLIGTGVSIACGVLMPLTGNILVDLGIGPRTLEGLVDRAPVALWWVLTAISWLGLMALLEVAAAQIRPFVATLRARAFPAIAPWAFVAITAIVYFAPIASQYGAFFDRYLLPMFVLGVLCLSALQWSGRGLAMAGVLSVNLGIISACFTHDYLSWNRARWDIAADLASKHEIPYEQIEAGFEFRGLLEERMHREGEGQRLGDFVLGVVSFEAPVGADVLIVRNVENWAPWGVKKVFGSRVVVDSPRDTR